jgi:hypothetical protein
MEKYCSILLLLTSTVVFAQASSNADQFAVQAGAIAGAAQACGQDITEYNSRINEAINVLGTNASDKQQALTLYDKTLSGIQYTQTKLHDLNCPQVIQSYQTLPIMRADYQTTVLPALANMNTASSNSGNATTAPTTSAQTTPSATTTPLPLD